MHQHPTNHTNAEPLYVTIQKDVFEAMATELEELRKHELEHELTKAENLELKQRINHIQEKKCLF